MKLLLEFFPLLLFFGAFRFFDIYVATGVLMGATAIQMVLVYLIDRRLQAMQKATLLLVLIFGSLTLVLHDERFIKWKPTVLYTAMSLALGLGLWVWRKNLLRMLLDTQISLPTPVWNRLNLAWVAYCAFMAAANAYVAAFYSTEAWVSFKLWGYAFPVAFLIGQGIYIARHIENDPA